MLDYSKKKSVIFPYKECIVQTKNTKEKVYRPMALIGIKNKNFTMPALIDTGSDKIISFMQPFGEQLGVTMDDFEGEPDTLRGLFGEGTAWAKHMDIWIGQHRFNIPIFWLTRPFDIESDYQMILGRKIIFDNFDVVFRQKEKKVYSYFKR